MSRIVGIPRALFYYKHFPAWEAFFHELGADLLVSPPSSRRILDAGTRICVNEACLPVKMFFGHLAQIAGRCDCLFVPRYTSIHRREYVCPKFGGLPDMVRSGPGGLPPLIDPEINLRSSAKGLDQAARETAARLGAGKDAARRALRRASERMAGDGRAWAAGIQTEGRGSETAAFASRESGSIGILLLAHPYMAYDPFVNMDIIDKINRLGGHVTTLEDADEDSLRTAAAALPKPMFWSYGTEALGSALRIAERGGVDGVIALSSFGCGIDSFVGYMAERRIRHAGIPFTSVTIDEHTAQAGVMTRLEAFLDTISMGRNHGRRVSAHG